MAVGVLAVALTGCAGASPQAAPFDGLWQVTAYGTATALTTVPPTIASNLIGAARDAVLSIDGELISLQAPCNLVGMETARIDGDRLVVPGGLGSTEIGCAPEVLALEEHVIGVLATGPRLAVAGDELTMTAPDGLLVEMIRVEPDPERPLVTSSPGVPPAESPGTVGRSVPPTPLPLPTGPELPTPAPTSPPRTTG